MQHQKTNQSCPKGLKLFISTVCLKSGAVKYPLQLEGMQGEDKENTVLLALKIAAPHGKAKVKA